MPNEKTKRRSRAAMRPMHVEWLRQELTAVMKDRIFAVVGTGEGRLTLEEKSFKDAMNALMVISNYLSPEEVKGE